MIDRGREGFMVMGSRKEREGLREGMSRDTERGDLGITREREIFGVLWGYGREREWWGLGVGGCIG